VGALLKPENMGCNSLATDIIPTCEALNKPGGVKREIYLGAIDDLDADGVTFGTDGDIEGLTFKATKGLVKVTGKIEKNSASEPIEPEGEGNIAMYNHTVSLVIYHSTQAQRAAIEDIVDLDRAFAIVPMRSGQIVVYGIDASDYREFGLKVSEGDDATGVNLNDMNAQTLTLAGRLTNKAILFDEDETLANNLSTIEGYLVSAV